MCNDGIEGVLANNQCICGICQWDIPGKQTIILSSTKALQSMVHRKYFLSCDIKHMAHCWLVNDKLWKVIITLMRKTWQKGIN